jgi:hypothetical protein
MSDGHRDHDFDTALRGALATLAHEAVPDADAAVVEVLPLVQRLPIGDRRHGRRALAAVVAVVVIGASVAIAVAVATHGKRSTLVENPQPSWTKVADGPLVPRSEQSAVFTGREVIVWGGRSDPSGPFAPAGTVGTAGHPTHALADGAAYDIATGRWRTLPAAPFGARYAAISVWTGTEMIIVGGQRDGTGVNGATELLRDGAAYDPAHNRWRRIPDPPGCSPSVGTWTGVDLVVGGPCAGGSRSFATFDPARDIWTNVPAPPGDASQLVSIDGRVFAWNGTLNRGSVLDGSARTWTELPAYGIPQQTLDSVAVAFAGNRFAVVGMTRGSDTGPDLASIALLDPNERAWHHYESDAVRPPDMMTAAAGSDVLIWPAGIGYAWFTGPSLTGEFGLSNAGRAPISLSRNFETLVAIGGRRFFVWGGRLSGTSEDPTNRPVNDGAIVELP